MMLKKQTTAAAKLLDIAGPLFAEQSYDALSTREIADRAEVNLSAISYHFGGKDGLYRAVFEKIIHDLAFIREFLQKFMDENLPKATEDVAHQRFMIQTIVHMIVGSVTDADNPRWRMQLIMRELQEKGPCFDIVSERHANIVHEQLSRLTAVATGHPATSQETRILTHAMIGMCLQFGLNEAFLSSQLGWQNFGPSEIKILQERTTENVWALLGVSPKEKAK